MATLGNIVQAEFFLIPKDTASPEAFISELTERLACRASAKVTVRFYDGDGSIERRALAMQRISRMRDAYLQRYEVAKGLLAAAFSFQISLQSGKLLRLQREQLEECIAEACRHIRSRQPIALENADRSFRLLRANERHELRQQISKASGVWCFIYENEFPGTLLSVRGIKMVAHAL